MSGRKYLLDTNIILYILAGDTAIANYLYQQELYISVVTEIALLSFKDLTAKEEKTIRNFLAAFRIIYIDDAVKQTAIQLRKEYRLKLPDAVIAATASSLNIPLITADAALKKLKHYN